MTYGWPNGGALVGPTIASSQPRETDQVPASQAPAVHALAVTSAPVAGLSTYHRNPRKGDVATIAKSLQVSGQYKPIVVNAGTHTGRPAEVLAGNHTLIAARDLGWSTIQVVTVDVDDDQAARIVAADNRIADLGDYDQEMLAELLTDIPDLEGTGFTDADLDALQQQLSPSEDDPADETPIPATPTDPVTKPGDVWALGNHRIVCGDCRDPAVVDLLLNGARVNVAVTSPPYASQRTYDESSGFKPIPPDEYVEWFDAVQANVSRVLAPDGSWFVNIKPAAEDLDTHLYVFDLVLAHVRRWQWHFATEFCWERIGVPKRVGRRFKNQFEPVYQFAKQDWKFRPDEVRHASDLVPSNVGPGGGGTNWAGRDGAALQGGDQSGSGHLFAGRRMQRNGYTGTMSDAQGNSLGVGTAQLGASIGEGMAYPGNRLPTYAGTHDALGHSAAFPIGLPAFFIRAYSDAGDVVFDPFMGSGSTLMAAEQTDRVAYGTELSPGYCDVIVRRWQDATGGVPLLNDVPHPL